jgi:hypothetical protein
MSYTPSSGTIRASDIRTAFGLTGSVSFSSRRSQIFWQSNAFRGTFPSTTIRLSDFYAKSGTSPVTPSTRYEDAYSASSPVQGVTNTFTYTVPLYYSMDIDCRAAGGGGAGGDGAQYEYNIYGQLVLVPGNGANGANGENTSFGSYNTAYGGSGGVRAASGSRAPSGAGSDNVALGGNGGGGGNSLAGGGAGGNGGFSSVRVLSPVNGGSGPAPGSVITVTVGKGGAGGGGFGSGGGGSPGRYGAFAVYIN